MEIVSEHGMCGGFEGRGHARPSGRGLDQALAPFPWSPELGPRLARVLPVFGDVVPRLERLSLSEWNLFSEFFRSYAKIIGGSCVFRDGDDGGYFPGSILSGRCRQGNGWGFAAEFAFWALLPRPMGLGLSSSEVKLLHFYGAQGNGLVMEHPMSGVLELKCNIRPARTSGEDGQGLFRWSRRTLVCFKGVFWDPIYGKMYRTLGEAVQYHITGSMITSSDSFEIGCREGRAFYFRRKRRHNETVHFLPWTAMEGPFSLEQARQLFHLVG